MKLTRREFVLLMILLIIAILFGEYYLLISPGMDRYTRLTAEQNSLDSEISTIQMNLQIASRNKERRDEMLGEIAAYSERFLDRLKPDVLLYYTHDLMGRNGFSPQTYTIAPLTVTVPATDVVAIQQISYQMEALVNQYQDLLAPPEEPGEPTPPAEETVVSQIEMTQYAISVAGTYEQIKGLLDDIHAQEKSILLSNLSLNAAEEDLINASMNIQYYGVAKINPDRDEFNTWPRDAVEGGTESPFAIPLQPEETEPDEEEPVETETTPETEPETEQEPEPEA